MKNLLKYQLPPLLWILLIYILSSIPKLQLTFETPPGVDKIVHAIMFFVLCLLIRRAFQYQDYVALLRTYALMGAVIFSIVYGILDEYHQQFVPGRVPDVYDVIADAGGVMLYAGVSWLIQRPRDNGESSQPG